MPRLAHAAAIALFVLVAPVLARAQSPRREARFEYHRDVGADRCPDETAFRDAVAARLGYDPFNPTATAVIQASVERARGGPGFRAQVRWRENENAPPRERSLTSRGSDCNEIIASMELAVAIAVDPLVLSRPTPPPENPTPPVAPSAPPPAAVVRPVIVRPPPPRPRRTVIPRVSVGVVASLWRVPGFSLGPTVQGGIRVRDVSLSIEGRAEFMPVLITVPSGRIAATLATASLVPCWHPGVFAACGLVTLGALAGQGYDVDSPASAVTFYADMGVRGQVEIPLSSLLLLRISLDMLVTLTPTILSLNGADVWTSPLVSASLGTALVAQFR